MNSKAEIIAPVWGQFSQPGCYGNWDFCAKGIECRADAEGAMVYVFGETKILAYCIEGAMDVLNEQTIATKEKEIKDLTRELYSLQNKVYEIEAEIEETEDEIGKLAQEVRELRLQMKQFQTAETVAENPNQIHLF